MTALAAAIASGDQLAARPTPVPLAVLLHRLAERLGQHDFYAAAPATRPTRLHTQGPVLFTGPTPDVPLDALARQGRVTHQRFTCRRCRRLASAYTWGPAAPTPRGLHRLLGPCTPWPHT